MIYNILLIIGLVIIGFIFGLIIELIMKLKTRPYIIKFNLDQTGLTYTVTYTVKIQGKKNYSNLKFPRHTVYHK